MGYVKEEVLEPGQRVRGAIVALDDDMRIRRALAVTDNIDFYRYEVSFKLLQQ
jgi:restriction system protein